MANIISEVADKVKPLGVSAVYGEPIQLDGVTVIPVAATGWGFGAGGGKDDSGPDDEGGREGEGGGGGAWSAPFGVYVRDAEGVTFRPNLITLIVVSIPLIWASGHAWARIIKALKK